MIYIGYGSDTLLGGAGRDVLRFDALESLLGVTANLTTNKTIFEDQGVALRFSGFEDLIGSDYADTLTGSALANLLAGSGGADKLSGAAGNDTLLGGAQADVMDGGPGADVFVYNALSDSAVNGADTILTFVKGQDTIDLSAIDAWPGGADDAFVFLGNQAFGANTSCLRYQRNESMGTTLIELRSGGSTSVDFQIVLSGLYDLTADSFVL